MHKLHQVMEGIPAVSSANSKDRGNDITGNDEEMEGAEIERPTTNNVLGDDFASTSSGMPVKINALILEQDFLDDDDSSASSDLESISSTETDEFDLATHRRASKHRDRRRKPSRKRKHSHSKRHSAIYVLIDKVIAAQSAANERYAALEERLYNKNNFWRVVIIRLTCVTLIRRLLLDKELEEKRIEAEAARQEAQRQHELRLLSTMAQQMACVLKVNRILFRLNLASISNLLSFYCKTFLLNIKKKKSINPLAFTGSRCETIATPITMDVSTGDRSGGDAAVPSKPHEVNGCVHPNDYADGTVYSAM